MGLDSIGVENMKFTTQYYTFRYIPQGERGEQLTEEYKDEPVVAGILRYYSRKMDILNKSFGNTIKHVEEMGASVRNVVEELAIYETRLKYNIFDYYYVLGKRFSKLTSSKEFTLESHEKYGAKVA